MTTNVPMSSIHDPKISLSSDDSNFPSSSSTPPMLHNIPLPVTNGPTIVHNMVSSGTNGTTSIIPAVPVPPVVTLISPTDVDASSTAIASPTQSSSTTTVCEADVHVEAGLNLDLEAGISGQTDENPETPVFSAVSVTKESTDAIVRHTQTVDRSSISSHDEVQNAKSSNPRPSRVRGKSKSFKQLSSSSSSIAKDEIGEIKSKSGRSKLARKASVPARMGHSPSDAEGGIVTITRETKGRRVRKQISSGGGSEKRPYLSMNDSSPVNLMLPEKEEYKIDLLKGNGGLGITVAGYVCEKGRYEVEK